MNKTLLIIICDFLLISILALVEFNPGVEEALVDEQSLRDEATEEMLELLQLSLEHESSQRREIESALDNTREELDQTQEALQQTQSTLVDVSSTLEQTREEKSELADTLQETQSSLQLTLREKSELQGSLDRNQERSRQLQEELREQQSALEAREADLANARENLSRLEQEQQQMSTRIQILDTEKQMLQQNLVTARAEVERARVEAERARTRSESLAAGVSELAAESTALKEEIRQAQALSMNAIFQRFEKNRVLLRFEWEERSAFASRTRESAIQTVLVRTDVGVFALFAVASTPLSSERDLRPKAFLKLGQRTFSVMEIGYMNEDRRLAAIPVPEDLASQEGIDLFNIAEDPLRFSNAVLVKDDQELYGEIPVRIPPGEPGLLEIETRLFNRLFGEFSPSVGDYVFSMSGELTGIMVGRDRARLLGSPTFGDFYRLR